MLEKLKNMWKLDRSAEAETTDSVLDPIKWKQRRGWVGLVFVSFGWGFTITGMFIGSQIAQAKDLNSMITAMIIGNLILFLIAFLVCIPAYRTGCNNALLFRMVFGSKGWKLPALVVIITGLGWQGSLVGMFPDVIIGSGNKGYALVGIIGGLLVVVSCVIGIKGLEFVGNLAVIFLVAAGVICIGINIYKVGGLGNMILLADTPKESVMGTGTIVDAIVGSWAVGAMFAGDFTRFAKKAWVVFLFVAINFCFAQPLLHILGATGVMAQGDHIFTNYVKGISMVFYIFCMLAMIFAIWTTCNSNLYFTQVQFANLAKKPMKISAIILGVIGTIAAAWGFFNYFGNFINFIVSLVPPLLGPWAMDYYVINKMKYDTRLLEKLPSVNWCAIAAYVIGILVPMIFTPSGLPIAIWNILTSSVAYLVLYAVARAMGKKPGYSAIADQGAGPYNPEKRAVAEGEIVG